VSARGGAGIALALALVAATARAGPEDLYGTGPRPLALAGSYAARGGDWGATFHNPAGLPDATRGDGFFEAGGGFLYLHRELHVTRSDGGNVSAAPTPDSFGVQLGSRFGFGGPLRGLAGGLALYLPRHLFRWTIAPDDDVQWAFDTDRTDVIGANFGLAYRVAPAFAFGVALRLSFAIETNTTGFVTNLTLAKNPQTGGNVVQTSTQLGTDSQVFARVTPIAGILVTPIPALRLGLVYRHQVFIDDWGSTRIQGVPDLGDLGYTHRYAHYYEPSAVTLAAAWNVAQRLDLSVDVAWEHWSAALTTNRDFYGDGIWGDVFTVATGARIAAARGLALSVGYRYRPSPIDPLGGPSNVLDSDRHTAALGFELDLGAFTRAFDARITCALAPTWLVTRSETKDFRRFGSDDAWQKNPGYPGYTYGGHVLATSVGVEARW
jgi:hypothetical protein